MSTRPAPPAAPNMSATSMDCAQTPMPPSPVAFSVVFSMITLAAMRAWTMTLSAPVDAMRLSFLVDPLIVACAA